MIEKDELREASIEVEGTELTFGQSMAVRVAIEMFLIELADPSFRKGLGPVFEGYQARLLEVRTLIGRGVA